MSQETVSIKVDMGSRERVYESFLQKGFNDAPVSNEYMVWKVVGSGVTAVLYSSGKLVVQGSGVGVMLIEMGLLSEPASFEEHIGVDEVGKGDYFGPMIVVACFVSEGDLDLLKSLGVADSKKLSDKKILEIGDVLIKNLSYKEIVVSPSEYERLRNEMGNVSVVLAYNHVKAVEGLVSTLEGKGIVCESVVFDQFSKRKDRLESEMKRAGLKMKISQFHKGESDVAVAAASVIARYLFLKEWESMEAAYDFVFPKGASEVIDAGREFVGRYGQEELSKVAKVSFRTTGQILSLF